MPLKPSKASTGFGVEEFDDEGRYVRADIGNLSVISLYVPSGSSGEERQAAKFRFMEVFYPHLKKLQTAKREVVLCGDWNIAHKPIDLKNWRSNQKNSGFLPEERAHFDHWFDDLGWVDVVRAAYPDEAGPYSWWSFRGKAFDNDAGWRIDYQIATPALAKLATSAWVDRAPSYSERWSDHAPVVVDYGI